MMTWTRVCSMFVTAAFTSAGTELVVLAASKAPDPRATMPPAVKRAVWCIIIIYNKSLTTLIGYDEPRLLGGSDATASPP
ncbi:hypothetical protein EST38_g11518 [Candolleomyces aberdarensis]|uniref:Amino acid permease/ SLC12A domain-containing protein n=1 Tax=Candolleomyces aberdarensis TaxID=2316362 RepID=A0A4Q2D4N6_9AGAR|nr:hypothetical protein EST38_g11518 [Candolleomyces aberdarensis]